MLVLLTPVLSPPMKSQNVSSEKRLIFGHVEVQVELCYFRKTPPHFKGHFLQKQALMLGIYFCTSRGLP